MEKKELRDFWDKFFGFKEGDHVFWQYKRDNHYFIRKYGRIIKFTSLSIVVEEGSGILVYFRRDCEGEGIFQRNE